MYKAFDLTGRKALVTGGNGGIGLGMAKALLQSGADVAIWGSNPDKTDGAVQQLSGEGGQVIGFSCDVGDESAVEACFARTLDALGGLDACFANAGVSATPVKINDMSSEEFRRVQRINVDGVFYTFHAAARHMIDNGGGSLVATASTAAVEG
ncbi:MAG: SDR family NAD(P)-dependent oxidoreductase, partial [Burkholderiaceae bacterium]